MDIYTGDIGTEIRCHNEIQRQFSIIENQNRQLEEQRNIIQLQQQEIKELIEETKALVNRFSLFEQRIHATFELAPESEATSYLSKHFTSLQSQKQLD